MMGGKSGVPSQAGDSRPRCPDMRSEADPSLSASSICGPRLLLREARGRVKVSSHVGAGRGGSLQSLL